MTTLLLNSLKKALKAIVPVFVWNSFHWLLALAAAVRYNFPSKDLVVIGITGTNGKSTVVQLLHDILAEFGLNAASGSSIRFRIKDKAEANTLKMTMPGRFGLQKFLRQAVGAGCQYAILEVTSEGLKQHRAAFINFDAVLITNIRMEHIESHGSFENYRKAKGLLFKKLGAVKNAVKKISAVNLDDPSAFYYADFPADQKISYGLFKENARLNVKKCFIPEAVKFSASGVEFALEGERYVSPLLGDFNLYNTLAAIALARAFEVPRRYIQKAVENFKGAPGRLETLQEKPFRAAIDYAHTPDALENVYRVARSFWLKSGGRLIGVLGSAGGGRDKWKRPQMGAIAERFCDQIFLTDEDPYAEDPERIIRDIALGIKEKPCRKILDRRLAIREALQSARPGDAVLITGKGAEKTMMTRFGALPWDEEKIVKEELAKLK